MSHLFAQSDSLRIPLLDQSVALVVGSPPYCDARTYGIDAQRDCAEWIDWMLGCTTEALRVARNCVIWVAAGVTRDRNYWPACEGLMYRWWQQGGSAYRPCYWHRVGIPGSGGDQWFRADVEMLMCFKRPGELSYSDNTACGHPPKWAPGGEMSHRLTDGSRRNQWGGTEKSGSNRRRNGDRQAPGRPSHRIITVPRPDVRAEEQSYVVPDIANPGNLVVADESASSLIHTTIGGGQLGWDGAHENEAPYPEAIPEFFIKSLTQLGDLVLDPFSGSGTTCRVAERLGRIGLGFDLRMSQCQLGRQGVERPHKPVVKQSRKDKPCPLFGDDA